MRIGLRIFLGYFLVVAMAALLLGRVFVAEVKPGVRQAMEDTLVDTANVLAELATDDFLAGRINDGRFASRMLGLGGRDFGAEIWGFQKRASQYRVYVTDAQGIVVFDTDARDGHGGALGRDYSRWNDVYLTLRGQYGARSTLSDPKDPDSSVMHVAAPLRDAGGRIVGVLTVAKPNRTIAPFIERSQTKVLGWGLALMGVALLIGLVAAWWLSRQLGRLRRYAQTVTAGERVALPAVPGEFGELGRALETMRARLEGKQYVEHYVHTLAHEMKAPLAAIRGSAELLELPMEEADRVRFVGNIRGQGERMAQMIDKLLALAAVEHRQQLERPEPVRLSDVAREVVEQCDVRGAKGGGRIRLVLPDAAPTVLGDAFLLRQAVVNLVENALDFSPPAGEVELRLLAGKGLASFEALDRGPGVPDYARTRVFERFYSLPRPGGGSRSSGLGLCFVAEVAALHGGHATLENREGGGAVATLELPLA